jgi:hypothetical protein
MSIYGIWFVATEQAAKDLWRIEKGAPAFNPFTKEATTADSVRVDEQAIKRLPHVNVKFLIEDTVASFFGAACEPLLPPHVTEPGLVRVPSQAVSATATESLTTLVARWKESTAQRPQPSSYAIALAADEALAGELLELAKLAVATNASIFGFIV